MVGVSWRKHPAIRDINVILVILIVKIFYLVRIKDIFDIDL